MTMPKLETGKYCYTITDMSKDDNGYIPVIVVEHDSGFYPLSGNGPHAAPWYWGQTFEGARAIAEKANNRIGITPQRAVEIVSSSFMASARKVSARR